MSWRFEPLRNYPHAGIVVSPGGEPHVAEFIRRDQKVERHGRLNGFRRDELKLLKQVEREARMRSPLA